MRALSTALFLLVAAVNLLPGAGVLSSARLEALYGVPIRDPNLEILLRHRAVLLAIVGGLVAAAAFHPPLRAAAVAAGLVSMLSFVAIAFSVGSHSAALRRVALVDAAASLVLVAAAWLAHVARRAGGGG
jgi:hypothetical protein